MILMTALFLFLSSEAFSQQDSCQTKLRKAQELFDSGQIEEIPQMLDSCMREGFNKEEIIRAYRLLIQVYLFDYNQEKAENTMLSLLTQFPEYNVDSDDPVEIVNLYKQFKTKPRYSMSINAGANLSEITVREHFSTGNIQTLKSEYKPGGIKGGINLSLERYFNSKAWITLGLGYAYIGYEVSEPMNFGREILTFTEKIQFAQLPHYFNYAFGNSTRFSPYVFAGGQVNYLLKSEGEFSKRSLVEISGNIPAAEKDVTGTRNKISYSALAGIGFRFKVPAGYVRATIYYSMGITDHVNKSERFTDAENLFYYNFIDDRIGLNSFNLSFGYSYIFYKTEKKLSAETN